MRNFQDIIIKLLSKNSKGLTLGSLRRNLRIDKRELKNFLKELKRLENEGFIVREGNKFKLVSGEFEKGYFQRFPAGFGFLLREGKEDVFIPPHATGGAMDGDLVLVAITKEKEGKKPEGKVIRVLERADKLYSGTVRKKGKRFIIESDDRTLAPELSIVKPKKNITLKEGLKVVFRVRGNEAKIEQVIGFEDDPLVDFKLVVSKFKLKEEFPQKALKEIAQVSIKDKREDLRQDFIVTIDPRDAKDFDDAISVRKEGDLYLLGVHIADVSAYVVEDSRLDREAMARGCSTYLIDRVIPMLPHELSSDLCSLKPGVDRYTMSVFIWIDRDGNVVKRRFSKSVINSKARLSYEDAQRILNGENLEPNSVSIFIGDSFKYIRDFLVLAKELAWILRENREKRGSLDFDLPEPVIELSASGKVISISPSLRLDSHRIIEEFMIKANESVAEFLEEKGYPAIFRVHEYPEDAKIRNFLRVAEGILGVDLKYDSIDKFTLQEVVKKAEEMGHGPIISYLLLRSMKKAKYSIQNIGHYGLSSKSYLHFTSPIRRYPDLVVHRILKRALSKKGWEPSEEYIKKLDDIAKLSSKREEISEKAEWELIDLKKYDFLKDKVEQVFDGVITHVVPQGLFVEIEEFLTEGFVPFSKLNENVNYDEDLLQASFSNKVIKLGNKVKVKIMSVNKWARSMELALYEQD